MMEVDRIFQVAEYRNPVHFGTDIGRHRSPQPRRAQRANTKTKHIPAGELRHARIIPQDRLPLLAALSASYPQIAGNPDRPYFGNSDGRPKRSQRAVRTFG